jgi:uncharacterized membrane protein YeaQ/YmgE (transglycosylase-associated protein family)
MQRMLGFIGMTVGGWVGWALGQPLSLYMAFMLSLIGSAAGLYYTRRWARLPTLGRVLSFLQRFQ